MIIVERYANRIWTEVGRGRTVRGVLRRVYGRRADYQPDSGVPGYGLLIRPCSGGDGWNVVARISWTEETR